jgi:carbon monoxide dehydrogenase subunit G
MDMTGERRIPAPREKVWEGLNDTDVLRASIPGCETLERLADDEMRATASVKIGPIAARFTGKVHLTDIDPPKGYHIAGEGQGGVAGFAKGGAAVRLAEDGDMTVLTYEVHAQVGGKMAQLGARLIDATARQMADAFFNRFAAQVGAPAEGALAEGAPVKEGEAPTPVKQKATAEINVLDMLLREPLGLPLVAWVGIVLWLAIATLLFKGYF